MPMRPAGAAAYRRLRKLTKGEGDGEQRKYEVDGGTVMGPASKGLKALGVFALALVFVLGPGSGVAHAVACGTSWANPVDGEWNVAGNWTNGVPDSTKTACIRVDGT
jgi:hypothetical protein